MKGNHALPNNHFRKTSLKIKVYHAPEERLKRLEKARICRAKRIYPVPVNKLRPIVRCGSIRYNRLERLGRGFTAMECSKAGLDCRKARSLSIAVDQRRRDSNLEELEKNAERIKAYLEKITIYDSLKQAKEKGGKSYLSKIMPIIKKKHVIPFISREEIASYK